MSYLQKAKNVYSLLSQGKVLEAFDKYYHDDVVMIEADGKSRQGKETNRHFQEKFVNDIKEFHAAGAKTITSNEDERVTMIESWMDITMKDNTRSMMEEVSVQKWQGDKIIYERFYYNTNQ